VEKGCFYLPAVLHDILMKIILILLVVLLFISNAFGLGYSPDSLYWMCSAINLEPWKHNIAARNDYAVVMGRGNDETPSRCKTWVIDKLKGVKPGMKIFIYESFPFAAYANYMWEHDSLIDGIETNFAHITHQGQIKRVYESQVNYPITNMKNPTFQRLMVSNWLDDMKETGADGIYSDLTGYTINGSLGRVWVYANMERHTVQGAGPHTVATTHRINPNLRAHTGPHTEAKNMLQVYELPIGGTFPDDCRTTNLCLNTNSKPSDCDCTATANGNTITLDEKHLPTTSDVCIKYPVGLALSVPPDPIYTNWKADVISFLRATSPQISIVTNSLFYTPDADGAYSQAGAWGELMEGWGGVVFHYPDYKTFSKRAWKQQLSNAARSLDYGKRFIAYGGTSINDSARVEADKYYFFEATYQLIYRKNQSLKSFYSEDMRARLDFSSHDYFDSRKLGAPIAPYQTTTISGCELFYRQFTKGIVVVNPETSGSATINISQLYPQLTASSTAGAFKLHDINGTTVETPLQTLPHKTAVILYVD
jgi:hypothetical protein